ncbi:MAG TPA: TfoX/Sxy family protein [Blastocatellia bacterium]|jgi:DNA transformation protein and related proteins|nr:TfoX/Sxy family protein [Blastocatellia bacterium]
MPVSKEYLDYVMDQLECCRPVVSKRMFGGIGLYSDALFFGLIDDDTLYFKVDDLTRPGYLNANSKPFDPYGDGNASMSYYAVPAEVLEDTDELKVWAAASVEAARRKAATKKTRAPRKKKR